MTEKTSPLPLRASSPFHRGERTLQHRLGVEDRMDQVARRALRDHMPEQHSQFYQQLPFIVLGAVAEDGYPWASMRFGYPGFIRSDNDKQLSLSCLPVPADPLEQALISGRDLGLLGIELHSRRRNRVSARIQQRSDSTIELEVKQSFGNCPKFIQTRDMEFVRSPQETITNHSEHRFTQFNAEDAKLIANADTFFVASAVDDQSGDINQGADVSHRGGRAGFVRIEGNDLVIPDYAGNHHFNTLGNFLLNPKAGLCFPDFDNGDLLLVTGDVTLHWEIDPLVEAFKGAERAWRFTLKQGIRLRQAMPIRWRFNSYSPHSLQTGDWQQAQQQLEKR